MNIKYFLYKFILIYFGILLGIGIINYYVDPFFNYRMVDSELVDYFTWNQEYSPIWKYGMSKQYIGYDSIWVGSSVSAHLDVEYLDKVMDVNCCTGIVSGGRPNIYEKLIRNVNKNNSLNYVFYELHVPHWCWEYIGTEYDIERWIPQYIQTDTKIDDAEYLLNRIILQQSAIEIWNLCQNKWIVPFVDKLKSEFGISIKNENNSHIGANTIIPLDTIYSTKSMALRNYSNTSYGLTDNTFDSFKVAGEANANKYVIPLIKENPDTQFIFIMPPTGVMFMSCVNEAGYLDRYLECIKEICSCLLQYDNVKIIASNLDFEYNTNCDNYMDDGHYEPSGAIMMVDCIVNGKYEITESNMDEVINSYKFMVENFEWPFLKINFVGERVEKLQNDLLSLGFVLEVTGVFDTNTENAVKEFQKKYGIEITGIAFDETLSKIEELLG